MNAPPPDERALRLRILSEVARTPSPTRAEARRRTALFGLVVAACAAAVFYAMGGPQRGERAVALVAFTAFAPVAMALGLLRVVASPRSMLGPPRGTLVGSAVALPLLLVGVALVAAVTWPIGEPAALSAHVHLACGVATVVQALIVLFALLLARRGSDPVHPACAGAALGAVAAASAAAMAYLRCPHAELLHGIVAHASPSLLLAAMGAALGLVLLRVR